MMTFDTIKTSLIHYTTGFKSNLEKAKAWLSQIAMVGQITHKFNKDSCLLQGIE